MKYCYGTFSIIFGHIPHLLYEYLQNFQFSFCFDVDEKTLYWRDDELMMINQYQYQTHGWMSL